MPYKKIKQFRLLKDYTQEHVAFEANISQSQLSKYESGESVPNAETLKTLAKILEVEAFEFLYENPQELKAAITRWQNRQV